MEEDNTRKRYYTGNFGKPQNIPHPTYWPIVLALGITLIFWGFVTYYLISILGVILLIIAMVGWIAILRSEYKEEIRIKNLKNENDS